MQLTSRLFRASRAYLGRVQGRLAVAVFVVGFMFVALALVATAIADLIGKTERGKSVGAGARIGLGVTAVLVVALAANPLGQADPGARGFASSATAQPTDVPEVAARPTATGRQTASSTPELTPELMPEPSAESVVTPAPVPTPVVVTNDTSYAVGATKSTLTGATGTYTWSDIEFGDELAKVTWVAKAAASAGCTFSWHLEPTYADPLSKSLKIGAGKSTSGSLEFTSAYDTATLSIQSTCRSWSLGLASYAPPLYWNPWGYNFKAGSYIYSPPSDFCDYFDCIPSFWDSTNGYVAQCRDLMFSHSGGRSGACSYHGGVYRALYRH